MGRPFRSLGASLFSFAATLLLLATLTFFLLRLLPGGPFDRERPLDPAVRAELEARYQLDRPLARQYISYLGSLARGDFGPSLRREGERVNDILAEGIPVTAFLTFGAGLCALLMGSAAGVNAAGRPGGFFDRALRFFSVTALSLPSFLLGALLVLLLAVKAEFFPVAFWGGAAHRVLPILTLALLPTAQVARLVRATVLEQANLDFLRTARAKGLPEYRVLWGHAFRNSLLPLAALAGPLLANLFAGTVVVETLFALPGLGAAFVEGVAQRDYFLATGLTVAYGAILVSVNLASELAFGLLDPRTREGEGR